MTIYMVFEPPAGSAPSRRAERIAFVPDRFTWSAFLFAPLWMVWHRLWIVLVGYLVVMAALAAALAYVGASDGARFLVFFLVELLIGFEAASLRRWTLARARWRELGAVVGARRELAEQRFFDRYVTLETTREMEAALAGTTQPAVAPRNGNDVVGLFPQPGGSA
jgi:hypothetical protein